MHTKELRADGEDEQRLHLPNAWQEAPIYSERERAALAWTEAVNVAFRTVAGSYRPAARRAAE